MKNKSLLELLEVEKEKPNFQIYCDMDGVLTNFEERFEHFSGMHPQEYEKKYGQAAFWELIDVKVGLRFWAGMKWMPGGEKLWSYISQYNPQVLTSPSKDNNSRLGKNIWVRNHLHPKPKVNFAYSADKQRFATPNSILIDDKKSNIEQWDAAGGIAIRCLYGDIQPVLQKLKEIGYE